MNNTACQNCGNRKICWGSDLSSKEAGYPVEWTTHFYEFLEMRNDGEDPDDGGEENEE